MTGRIVLGSRGSELALAQARLVENALRRAWPKLEVELEIIRTSGDENATPVIDRKAGRKGMFTRAIERELVVRRIDLAVHSAKDLPSERHSDLELRATLPRASTADVLITKNGAGLTSLAPGAVIATGSVRRQHQLRRVRPDLQIVDLRGNVPTRLRKLEENEAWSGIILAYAGLERLGLKIVGQALRLPPGKLQPTPRHESRQPERFPYNFPAGILSQDDFVPAGGQGIIALQVRRDDDQTQPLVDAINHPSTLLCLRAEREFLRLLDGDCDSPVGVQARMEEGEMILRAQVFDENGLETGEARSAAEEKNPEKLAASLYDSIYGKS